MEKLFNDELLLDSPQKAVEKMNKELERAQEAGVLVEFETISAQNLAQHPNSKVIHIFQEVSEFTSVHQDYNGQGNSFPLPSKVTSTSVIIAKPASRVVENLIYQMKSFASGKVEAEKNLKISEAELTKVARQCANLDADLANARKHTLDYSKEAKEAWAKCSTFEKDISKLRRALGEIKFNEILLGE